MRYLKNILISIICFFIISYMYPSYVNAFSLSDIFDGGDIFTQSATEQEIFNEENQENTVSDIYYILLGVGIIIAFAIGIMLGIQFITAGVEGQAKIKEKLIPYIIGCIVVFGGFGIWRFVINMSTDVLDLDRIIQTQKTTTTTPAEEKQKTTTTAPAEEKQKTTTTAPAEESSPTLHSPVQKHEETTTTVKTD